MGIVGYVHTLHDRYVEHKREESCKERMDTWRQVEFTGRMTEMLDKFREQVDPEAQLVFAASNRALIIIRDPSTGTQHRFPFYL